MIRLIATCEPGRLQLVPQFVGHYRRQGVEDFILSLQIEPGLDERTIEEALWTAEALSQRLGISRLQRLDVAFDAMALRAHHDCLQERLCTPGDWIVWADVDEFHWFDAWLPDLCASYDQAGYNAARGHFIDRAGRDGELRTFDPDIAIWAQFPIGCDATKAIAEGMTKKVVLARREIGIRHANHDPLRHQAVSWAPLRAPIFHFKWQGDLVARLRARLTPEWKARCPWWPQSAALLDAIVANGGRLPLAHVGCFDFGDDDFPAEHFPYETNSRYRERWVHWQSALPEPAR